MPLLVISSSAHMATSDTMARKKLQDQPHNSEKVWLSPEAERLKRFLLTTRPKSSIRFSVSRMRKVVKPPVQIPKEIADYRAWSCIVSGANIPLTQAMWKKQRKQMARRIPDRIQESVHY